MDIVSIKTVDGDPISVGLTAIEALDADVQGNVLLAGDPEYDSSRKIWNGIFDRKPSIIARCAEPGDIVSAVKFARENRLLLSVKGGGHNSAGTAAVDGGMMIDLSLMRRVTVDSREKTATVEGGALLGDVDAATQRHGLAVSAGIISHTGVGGLTLGGGFGWISRKYGLTVDNLISAELVTADGRQVTARANENEDLFWGIRGGGGNFGVVTSFTFRCAEIGTEVFSGLIVKNFTDARKYMQFHRDYLRDLPDEMTVSMVIRKAPPLPFLDEAVHGNMVVIIPFVWLGEKEKGEELIEPIRKATISQGEAIGMNPWVNWQSGFDPLVEHGARNYWKSHHLSDLSDGCIDAILESASKLPTEECEVFIPHMEGAPARVPETETAFAHRYTPFLLNIHTRWRDASDDEKCLGWVKDFHDRTRPFAKGVYVNFISQEGEDRVKDAYTPSVWKSLVEVKKRWDPTNLFRMNQNIKP